MVYLDNAATTPIAPEVLEAMMPFLRERFGNPNAKYYALAEEAKHAVENARENMAKLLGIKKEELIFTSGGTESNNMILKGIAFSKGPKHIITSQIEHSSVLEVCEYLESIGWSVTYLKPDETGIVSPEDLKKAIRDNTILVSIGWVNSEIGTIQNIQKLSGIAAENKLLFHTDATQAVSKMNINLKDYPHVDFMSFSSHKIFGPKGSGAAILRHDQEGLRRPIVPLIHGGNQEHGLRGGTLAVANIIGFAKALELEYSNRKENHQKLNKLDELFLDSLRKKLGQSIVVNNEDFQRVPGIINIRFKGINNQMLLKRAKDLFAASTGSACSNTKPSKVLEAIGFSTKEIKESIRFSLSHFTKEDELSRFIDEL